MTARRMPNPLRAAANALARLSRCGPFHRAGKVSERTGNLIGGIRETAGTTQDHHMVRAESSLR
jgi:putative component of membrane protein insertase Oxa1/YidC/SpoIIIJ protein YidD